MKVYRQGNMLFVECKRPSGKKLVRRDGRILEGEATGHVHRLAPQSLAVGEVYEIEGEGKLFLSADGEVSIVHEEHAPLVLPPADYEIVRQREYAPQATRNVAD